MSDICDCGHHRDDHNGTHQEWECRRCECNKYAEGREGPPRTTLADGTQVYPQHTDIITEGPRKGQQRDYIVLAEEERAKGFVRPVRRSYLHLKCGTITIMSQTIAETYARNPYFYNGTFCCGCGTHFPVGPKGEFVWDGTNEKVGT